MKKKTHLRAVGAGPGVGHREDARARVLESEVLVGELLSVDRLAAGAVAAGEVAALEEERREKRGERREGRERKREERGVRVGLRGKTRETEGEIGMEEEKSKSF